MSEEHTFVAFCSSQEQAHAACIKAYAHARALLDNGDNALVKCGPALETVGVRQRRFFHGVVLRQISEQARVDGIRYTGDLWKEYFRRLFLTERWVSQRLPGQKKATPIRKRQSTEELGVRGYADLIEKVIAYAVIELGVDFHFEAQDRTLMRSAPDEPDEPEQENKDAV